jgi:hypothetical protein
VHTNSGSVSTFNTMIFQIEDTLPLVRGSLFHYVEMYPHLLESKPQVRAVLSSGRVQNMGATAPQDVMYAEGTFSDIGNIVAPMAHVMMELSWAPYCEISEPDPIFSVVGVSSSIGDIEFISGLPEVRGLIKGEYRQKLMVRAPKPGVFISIESATPLWGDFIEPIPLFYADLWKEGGGYACQVIDRRPTFSSRVVSENRAVFKIKEPGGLVKGAGSVYEVQSSWTFDTVALINGRANIHQTINIGAWYSEPNPIFRGWGHIHLSHLNMCIKEHMTSHMDGEFTVENKIVVMKVVDKTSSALGLMQSGSSHVANLIETTPKVEGVQTTGTLGASVIVGAGNGTVSFSIIGGHTCELSVTGSAKCSGVINTYMARPSVLSMEAPSALIEGCIFSGHVGQAIMHDVIGIMGGIGREYISFR